MIYSMRVVQIELIEMSFNEETTGLSSFLNFLAPFSCLLAVFCDLCRIQ